MRRSGELLRIYREALYKSAKVKRIREKDY